MPDLTSFGSSPLLRIFLALTACYLFLCLALFAFQSKLLYHPQPRTAANGEGSVMTLKAKDIGLEVSVIVRDGPQAIIYFGGNAEDVSQNLRTFAEVFPNQSVYLLHYRGFGGSAGTPTEKNLHADAALLLAHVKNKHAEVALIGRSLGSGIAVKLASTSNVRRLVLITPYDSIANIAAQVYPFVPVKLLLRDRYESILDAPKVRVSTTIIAAKEDTLIPLANTENLLRHFEKGVATMSVIQGVGHGDIQNTAEYYELLKRAVEK